MNSHDLKVNHQVNNSLQIPSIEEDKIDLRYTKHDTSKCIQQSTQKQTKTTTQSGQFETSDLAMKPNAARKGTSSRNDRCLNRGFGLLYKWSKLPKVESKRAALQMRSRRLLTTAKKQDSSCHLAVAGYVWDCDRCTQGCLSVTGLPCQHSPRKAWSSPKSQFDAASRQGWLTQGAGPTCGSPKITFKSAGSSW